MIRKERTRRHWRPNYRSQLRNRDDKWPTNPHSWHVDSRAGWSDVPPYPQHAFPFPIHQQALLHTEHLPSHPLLPMVFFFQVGGIRVGPRVKRQIRGVCALASWTPCKLQGVPAFLTRSSLGQIRPCHVACEYMRYTRPGCLQPSDYVHHSMPWDGRGVEVRSDDKRSSSLAET